MTTLDDLASVERALRAANDQSLSSDSCGWWADTIAAFIAAQRARDLVANLSAELSRVTQKGHANG